MAERILIATGEEALRASLSRHLERSGYTAVGCETAEEALAAAEGADFAVALVDTAAEDGLALCDALAAVSPDTRVVVLGDPAGAAAGVREWLARPARPRDVEARVEALCEQRRLVCENARLRQQLAERDGDDPPVARGRAMQELLGLARQVASSGAAVLIEGEPGSGKEALARFIHRTSPRQGGPFRVVHLAALPEALVDSHLFGSERGALGGAEAQAGMLRAAADGTLLLDEIGALPPAQQARLLRAIETREIFPVGADRPVRIGCRIIAATSGDLSRAVGEERFRGDLYYRLSAIRLRVPPLRERPDDVPALVHHFLARFAAERGRPAPGIEAAALQRLVAYRWPGNVRELAGVVERAVVVAGRLLTLADLPPEVAGGAGGAPGGYHEAMADFERALIAATLERTAGDRREAARALGLSLATLYRRIEKLQIHVGRREPAPRVAPANGNGNGVHAPPGHH